MMIERHAREVSETPPVVRLAVAGSPKDMIEGLKSPTAQVAVCDASSSRDASSLHENPHKPALLISYAYLDQFDKQRHLYDFRDWVMDSGAFSAYASGYEIDIDEYVDVSRERLSTDAQCTAVFSLDVIGDWRASLKNYEYLRGKGIEVIPTIHCGCEPWSVLTEYAASSNVVALGGLVRKSINIQRKFVEQCFARTWPHRLHGFGMGGEKLLMEFPFYSVDTASWVIGPCCYGTWKTFGKLSVRGGPIPLRQEVEWHLDLERRAQARWEATWEAVADSVCGSKK